MKLGPSLNFLSITLGSLLSHASGFTIQSLGLKTSQAVSENRLTSTLFQSFNDDQPSFTLSASDMKRLQDLRQRKCTMPILILGEPILPNQSMVLASGGDRKLARLIEYVLQEADHDEIGIIGINPHTQSPLNIGVTASISKDNVSNAILHGTSIHVTGKRRFEIEEQPYLDESGCFFMADVEITEDREEIMSSEQQSEAEKLSKRLPGLVKKWCELVYRKGLKNEVKNVMSSIGPMPSNIRHRAIWVGSLVNPLPSLKLCLEIRPAMLACKNNYERIHLAVLSLQSSIDYLSNAKKSGS
mmetsp:Transcript_3819/g.5741  ORF Transcript_3819/g.5741 Transcript_3819/m.5741 type:complete len:300 (-) Transcript_3819:153-1052(-)|eukprot:CAMPEP_0197246826 /NCGR_PEP_ID=MMETSP1429-20130617/23488_1 /TAXON_ID=49237 /ORGANISM="Chaetoceros  sp., Strain UNC1202" /LENGTH=299 /DNA_ID=CAMNT_0042707593 /DNA_START=95 /DNA_END=994 /DNA_ORIENTATION=-